MTVFTEFQRVGEVNSDTLDAALRAAVADVTGMNLSLPTIKVHSNSPLTPGNITTLQSIIDAHNPSLQSASQDLFAAQNIAINQAKVYLRNQLNSASTPNPTTLVNTIKPVVDANTVLTNMLTNQVALMNSALGWSLTLNPATAQTRTQYLLAVEAVIGLIG